MVQSPIGQLLLIGVPGPELDAETANTFREIQPGGFILFGRNIRTPGQLRKLVDDLRCLSEIEPIITIDQECGRVSRLKLIGNEPPNAQQLRVKNDLTLIKQHGHVTGRLLRIFGFNLDLCPVLDISFDDEADNSLRGRCYGTSVEQVIRNAGAFNEGLRAEGIASCGIHFPGYCAATLDAHHELPVIERTRQQLEANELSVFRNFIGRDGSPSRPTNQGRFGETSLPNVVDSMMICHAQYPQLDEDNFPASLSHNIITGLLRQELGFDGLVMTDDLDMGAILNHYGLEEIIRLAIRPGNDLAMICHRIESLRTAHEVLQRVPSPDLDRALASVAQFKKKLVPPDPFSEEAFRRRDAEVWDVRVATLGAEQAAM